MLSADAARWLTAGSCCAATRCLGTRWGDLAAVRARVRGVRCPSVCAVKRPPFAAGLGACRGGVVDSAGHVPERIDLGHPSKTGRTKQFHAVLNHTARPPAATATTSHTPLHAFLCGVPTTSGRMKPWISRCSDALSALAAPAAAPRAPLEYPGSGNSSRRSECNVSWRTPLSCRRAQPASPWLRRVGRRDLDRHLCHASSWVASTNVGTQFTRSLRSRRGARQLPGSRA